MSEENNQSQGQKEIGATEEINTDLTNINNKEENKEKGQGHNVKEGKENNAEEGEEEEEEGEEGEEGEEDMEYNSEKAVSMQLFISVLGSVLPVLSCFEKKV